MSRDLRPLDPMRSIKGKLGLLVVVSIAASSVLAVVGTRLGLSPWVTVPGAVLVALGITQVLARGMTSPLRDMTAAAQRMSEGDYSQRVRATSADEVGDLARAFNRMAATLEMVDRQRGDLVANVSHELRTPLSALRAVLENLVDGVSTPDAQTLGTALAQTERLGRLTADLLDLSRVESGAAALNLKTVAVGDLLAEAVSRAEVHGVGYAVDAPDDLTLTGDPERLHQLLANLLENAARHSPPGGRVRVRAALADGVGRLPGDVGARGDLDGNVVVEVTDDGPGIAEADRDRVFERFTTSSAHASGTGLGLAIARTVAHLHGGSIAVADTASGCTIRVTLPQEPAADHSPEEPVMSTLTPPAPLPQPPPQAPAGGLLTSLWPDRDRGRPLLVLAAAVAGTIAATVLPERSAGLGTALVMASIVGVVLAGRLRRERAGWSDLVDVLLIALLLSTLVLRDALWITMLCLFAALALTLVSVTRVRSVVAAVGAAAAVPLAGIRGLPWLARSLKPAKQVSAWLPVARTVLISGVLLVVFGALFASADPVFGRWVDAVTPDITWNDLPARFVLGAFVAAGTLAAAYVALSPPALERLDLPIRRSRRTFEWLAPVVAVDAVFAAFLVAQATAMFGGHDYLQRTVGLTYAEYVHQGFGQLTVATALTLTLVGWAARKGEPGRLRDLALGALCVMTLVVVVSALYRMQVYEEAYGFTRLRLFVSVFEGWLGAVVLMVLVAGALRRSTWLVPVALRVGAAGLLGLALLNPDLWIAKHNIARADAAGVVEPVDWNYLGGLSADAYPALVTLPDAEFGCATRETRPVGDDDWLAWNASRAHARNLVAERPPASAGGTGTTACP